MEVSGYIPLCVGVLPSFHDLSVGDEILSCVNFLEKLMNTQSSTRFTNIHLDEGLQGEPFGAAAAAGETEHPAPSPLSWSGCCPRGTGQL